MKTNEKATDWRVDEDETSRLAGGFGMKAAKQGSEALLRRSVLANLLWEDQFYEDGISVVENIKRLVPQVEPARVAAIAIEARTRQKLRHVPLLLAREMARLDSHKQLVGKLLPEIILRADEITEFLALYWLDGKQPLGKQVKIGLRNSFTQFDEYQLAKYNRDTKIKLRDVMFLAHPTPKNGQEELFKRLANNELAIPDTWEVALSSGQDKKGTWTRLINERKLGGLAFIRNLRNMEEVKVDRETILKGFETINPRWLLPLNFLGAAKAAPRWERELEALMLRGLEQAPKLPGYTILIVDVSGSMNAPISSKSIFSRMDAGSAMVMLASEVCEQVAIYATAGRDTSRQHKTKFIKPRRGFALIEELNKDRLGGGGIFTRQCLEFIRDAHNYQAQTIPHRIIVFSDSQDCDLPSQRIPQPFGQYNYIIDVSAHSHGINYEGIWTAEISGWSEHFLEFIIALEGNN